VFVEEVEITAPQGAPVVFPCRCWLAEDEDDGQTTRVLVPGQSLMSQYDSKKVVKLILDKFMRNYISEESHVTTSSSSCRFDPHPVWIKWFHKIFTPHPKNEDGCSGFTPPPVFGLMVLNVYLRMYSRVFLH